MKINDRIIKGRNCGVVRCGLSSLSTPTVLELAREFGLRDDPACYHEIDEPSARRLVWRLLHQDLVYRAEIMPEGQAGQLADLFFSQFRPEAIQFYTNGTFHEDCDGASWEAVTQATLDTGVLVISPYASGCFWIEDED